tara:strand:- start:369 stop:548 length:180 start_codon:yes stop_codon:yes gene_type:complete
MTDYVVEDGFVKFNHDLNDESSQITQIPVDENLTAEDLIQNYIDRQELTAKWLEQLNQG